MEKITWKDVVDYEGRFEVSNKGEVRDGAKIKTKKNGKSINGDPKNVYKRITFKKDGKRIWKSVHRLVAEVFVEGHTSERDDVDHKDEDRTNNHVENLQWVSSKENNELKEKRIKLRKMIKIMKGNEELNFEEIKRKIAEDFENSDIFSFDEQFVIAYKEISLSKKC